MSYAITLISLIEVILVIVPTLLAIAFLTVAERKTMASMQRRLGPNLVGYYGLLQAFADALKLLLKEYVSPTQANSILFFMGPVITLVFSILGFAVIPYGPGLEVSDFNLAILYSLAMSSLSTYGILLAGWSANSKYAFLGSLRSTAQLISYELILSSAILLVILLSGSLSLSVNVEMQKAVWFIFPLFPVFVIFFIGSVAETNRAPFDLAEAESELVSGFMTEHAAVIFVFFFLAEYGSILLICTLTSILFMGGYLFDPAIASTIMYYFYYFILVTGITIQQLVDTFNYDTWFSQTDFFYANVESGLSFTFNFYTLNESYISYAITNGIVFGLTSGFKSCIMMFIFIWVRASYPRIRYDQLMSFCWTELLPLIIGLIIVFPCLLYSFAIIPTNLFIL